MRSAIPRPTAGGILALGILALGSTGCQSTTTRMEPLTTNQILAMVNEKVPADQIISRIRESHTVYMLHARDLKDLLERGVPEAVVDEMMQTRVREAQARSAYYYPYYYGPYYYGPYFGFGYGMSFSP